MTFFGTLFGIRFGLRLQSCNLSILLALVAFLLPPTIHAEEPDGFTALINRQKAKEAQAKPDETAEPPPAARSDSAWGGDDATSKKKSPENKPRKKPRQESVERVEASPPEAAPTRTAEAPAKTDEGAGESAKEKLIFRGDQSCYVVEFESRPGKVISCSESLPLSYTQRECDTGKVQEAGEAEAAIACPDKNRIVLRFRTGSSALVAVLKVHRENNGRSGVDAHYRVEKAGVEEGSLTKLLAAPKIKSTSGDKPEESPIKFKFSGFAWTEWERTSRFGYDVGAGTQVAQPNFDPKVAQPNQSNLNFFSNVSFEIGKDNTSLVSLFEIGEVYFGDTSSGGAQGARATNIFEVRNLYLNHDLSDRFSVRAGIVTTGSDPRSFIFNDHVATVQASYKTDLSEGLIWYGNSAQNRPAAPASRDQYFGISGTLGFLSKIKATAFGLYRSKAGDSLAVSDGAGSYVTETGDSQYYWLGGTFESDALNPVGVQATAIGNWGRTVLNKQEDHLTAYLADAKTTFVWDAPQATFTLEGLMTSGGKNVVDSGTGKQILGRRRGFASIIGAAYLLTVATSDGVDDAPGSPKQSIIGNLGMDEGLRALVFSTSINLNKKTTGLVRLGHLSSAEGSSATGKTSLGNEIDLEGVYQLSPSTSLQGDFGVFYPGDFYTLTASANLAALKMKFSF